MADIRRKPHPICRAPRPPNRVRQLSFLLGINLAADFIVVTVVAVHFIVKWW